MKCLRFILPGWNLRSVKYIKKDACSIAFKQLKEESPDSVRNHTI